MNQSSNLSQRGYVTHILSHFISGVKTAVTKKVADKKPGKAPPRNTYWKLPGVPED